MPYDFSLLPAGGRDRFKKSFVGYLILFLLYAVSMALSRSPLLAAALQVISLLCLCALTGYLLWGEHLDRKAVQRFIAAAAPEPLSENDMWAAVPPCFVTLRDNPDVVDARVQDGYIFQISDNQSCLLFTFEYAVAHGNRKVWRSFTIAVTTQPKVFPHLFLDSKQNGASDAYDRSQRLQLEGDFQDYFNLYVPDGEQVDTLVLFSPDVMRTLVRGGRPYDIELMGNTITLIASGLQYSQRALPALFRFLDALSRELNDSSVPWDEIDVSSALTSQLSPRKFDTRLAVLGLALAAVLLVISWR